VRFYVAGKLSRVQRDTNGDDKPDVFEIYREGYLERMGIDGDFDGKVDVWHRDEIRAAEQEAKEQGETQKSKEGSESDAADDSGPKADGSDG
jgi:hypothetical protein